MLVLLDGRAVAKLVRRLDPDFLVGFEVQKNSWGYVLERGAKLYTRNPKLTP